MAYGLSDNFNADANDAFVPGLVDASASHARLRKKRMFKSLAATGLGHSTNDKLVMGTFKSSDRLYDLQVSTSNSNPTAGAIDMGFVKAALSHDPDAGTAITNASDIFYDAAVLTTALSRDDAFVDATDLVAMDRGKRLWELVNAKTASTYTKDPKEDWDLVIDFVTALSAHAVDILIEATIVSFG